jgi:hypothetical protein
MMMTQNSEQMCGNNEQNTNLFQYWDENTCQIEYPFK